MSALADVAASACALLFLAAVLGKLDRWGEWSRLTAEIPGPALLSRSVRVTVPAVESAIVGLSVGWPIAGLAAAAVFLPGFALAVFLLARELPNRECNCFGAIAPAKIGPRLAERNIALASVAAVGWYIAQHQNLQALSLSTVLMTLLFGAIALMLFQYRRLRNAALTANKSPR